MTAAELIEKLQKKPPESDVEIRGFGSYGAVVFLVAGDDYVTALNLVAGGLIKTSETIVFPPTKR